MLGFSAAAVSAHQSGKYRPDIDGLRAIAVSSVVVCHAFPSAFPGGFIGVDIFFVISGYLITTILFGDLDKNQFSLWRFYDRRVRRIFPALIATLLVTLLIGWFLLFKPEFNLLGRHVDASALFSENFLLWSESGYFDVSSEKKPLLHLWSLAIEEQFYIFWPMLMYIAHRGHVRFITVVAILGALSFAVNLYDIGHDQTAAYFSPIGRFWELMFGSCLAYFQAGRSALLDRVKNPQSILGGLMLVASLVLTSPERDFPGFWALLPTFGTFLIISAGQQSIVNRWILSARPMVWIGLISYPLYLWHWPLLSFSRIAFGGISVRRGLMVIALSVAAAFLTFIFLERPFRGRSGHPGKPVALVVAMLAVLAGGAVVTTSAIYPRLFRFDAPSRTEWDFLRSRTADFVKSGNGIYPLHADRPRLALFIGDSQIAQYAERIDKVIASDPNRLGAILAIGGGCIPIAGAMTADIRRAGCWALRDKAFKMAAESRFTTIVIGGRWNQYFTDDSYNYDRNGNKVPLTAPLGRTAAMDRLEREISDLVATGKRVKLLLSNPTAQAFNPTGQGVRLALSTANFTPNMMVSIDADQMELRRQLIAVGQRAGADIIDPMNAYCSGDTCRATTETGMPLFKDDNHFNPDWAVAHADFVDSTTAP